MVNFDFVKAVDWPEIHADCARAESYALTDPRSACFYSRRAVEHLVDYLYDVLGLPIPYQDDLSARINDAAVQGEGRCGDRHEAQPDPQARQPRGARPEADPASGGAGRAAGAASRDGVGGLPPLGESAGGATEGGVRSGIGGEGRAADPGRSRQARRRSSRRRTRPTPRRWPRRTSWRRPRTPRSRSCVSRSSRRRPPIRRSTTATTPRPRPATGSSTCCWPRRGGRCPRSGTASSRSPACRRQDGIGFVDYVLWGADGLPLAIVEAKTDHEESAVGSAAGQAVRRLLGGR